jgi:hypothetical protein
VRGKLQAAAVTWARTSGGKTPRGTRPRRIFERLGFDPAAAPLTDDPIGGADLASNLLITPVGMVMGGQDNPSAQTGGLCARMSTDELPELQCLLWRQLYRI